MPRAPIAASAHYLSRDEHPTVDRRRRGSLSEGEEANSAVAGATAASIDLRKLLPRKEVIQPHLPIRLPCYDFTPITNPTFGG